MTHTSIMQQFLQMRNISNISPKYPNEACFVLHEAITDLSCCASEGDFIYSTI